MDWGTQLEAAANPEEASRSSIPPQETGCYLGAKFRELPIIPLKDELVQSHLNLVPKNLVGSPYSTLLMYLETQFRLLREDCVDSLRQGIQSYRNQRRMARGEVRVYERVKLERYICGDEGLEHVVSCRDSRILADPEDSKVLINGSLVCLSSDQFRECFIFGVVCAPSLRTEHLPPFRNRILLRIVCPAELDDFSIMAYDKTYSMVESATAYFEAYHYVLKCLSSETMERVPFTKYLVNVESKVDPPSYLLGRGGGDEFQFEKVFPSLKADIGRSSLRILEEWPEWPGTLDSGQLMALKHGLTKELAIIQGPPGTGKTFLGLLLVRLLLANFPARNPFPRKPGPPGILSKEKFRQGPILIICMTNHALDQFLEGIFKFEQNLIRVGSRSDSQILKGKVLSVVLRRKGRKSEIGPQRRARKEALMQKLAIGRQMSFCLRKCTPRQVKRADLTDIATESQLDDLYLKDISKNFDVYKYWLLGNDRHYVSALASAQASAPAHPTDSRGLCREFRSVTVTTPEASNSPANHGVKGKFNELHHFPFVWSLSREQRHILHEHWLEQLKLKHQKDLQVLMQKYEKACEVCKVADQEYRVSVLRQANVVGMTTTAAAHCKEILQSLNSEILIVEEAAEVLEAHILASLSPSVKHLVLIGDHLQLRPSTAVHELGKQHQLDVSMFERLVQGGVEHVTLQEQRRMRPAFSRLVRSLYPGLRDHHSVSQYPNIEGVSSNIVFFDHDAWEDSDEVYTSKVNRAEAGLVVGLALHFLNQGLYSASSIAVVTMYSGQVRLITALMQEAMGISTSNSHRREGRQKGRGRRANKEPDGLPRITSVDGFQGEEADIIILSLVRNRNSGGGIGFLKISNRVCVALTRAKKGLYMFGNARLLAQGSPFWSDVITCLHRDGSIRTELELVCPNHPETRVKIRRAGDFDQVKDGICSKKCRATLACGHPCGRACHPGSHDWVKCHRFCTRKCSKCRTRCGRVCHGTSECPPCALLVVKAFPRCGHSQEMSCSAAPALETCLSPCPRLFPCGHPCIYPCGHPCGEACETRVTKRLPCGHTADVGCNEDPRSHPCRMPCGAMLPHCPHLCQGTCGECKGGGQGHPKCLLKCTRTLPCGHPCMHICSEPCSPNLCYRRCEKRCLHGKCGRACGESCEPCRKPCKWRCGHHSCKGECHEVCQRPRCDVPCNKKLRCGHPCIGLCGEPCPDRCRFCHPKTLVKPKRLGLYKEKTRFIQLQDCDHIFEVNSFDALMDSEEKGDSPETLELKRCPECRTVIWKSLRYANVNKNILLKLEALKVSLATHHYIPTDYLAMAAAVPWTL